MKFHATLMLLATVFAAGPISAAPALAALAAPATAATARDGHQDFDFLLGTWRTHYRRLRHPLTHSHDWYGCDGTAVVRSFWKGSANIEDGDLRCPTRYVRGMTLRLYSRTTHDWSLYWGNQNTGLAMPPQVGRFDGKGTGDFLSHDTFDGKPVIVRYRWTLRSADHPHFEQAFSTDNGKTWEVNWITDYTRITLPAGTGSSP